MDLLVSEPQLIMHSLKRKTKNAYISNQKSWVVLRFEKSCNISFFMNTTLLLTLDGSRQTYCIPPSRVTIPQKSIRLIAIQSVIVLCLGITQEVYRKRGHSGTDRREIKIKLYWRNNHAGMFIWPKGIIWQWESGGLRAPQIYVAKKQSLGIFLKIYYINLGALKPPLFHCQMIPLPLMIILGIVISLVQFFSIWLL